MTRPATDSARLSVDIEPTRIILAHKRREQGLSYRALAARSTLSQGALVALLDTKRPAPDPTVETLASAAKALGFTAHFALSPLPRAWIPCASQPIREWAQRRRREERLSYDALAQLSDVDEATVRGWFAGKAQRAYRPQRLRVSTASRLLHLFIHHPIALTLQPR